MKQKLVFTLVITALCIFLVPFHVLAMIYISDTGTPYRVLSWPENANGNVTPSTNLSGSNTTLSYPGDIAVDNNWLYVSNMNNNSVDVFPINATGNVAPTRSIQGANTTLNSPRSVAVDSSWIYVSNPGNNSVDVFPINTNGNVAPTRSIQGVNTTFNAPYGIAVDSNWIYVSDLLNSSIDIFPINATGNVAPTRSIQGANTLVNFPNGLALTPAYSSSISVPAMNGTGVIIFMMLTGIVAVWYLRRQKKLAE